MMILTASCSLSEDGPEVHIVVGEVTLKRNDKTQPVSAGVKLKLWDSLTVASKSKMKITSGSSNIFVNENSAFQLIRPSGPEAFALKINKGEFHLVMRNGESAVCRLGDAFITIKNADAAVSAGTRGELPQIAVLRGDAFINRSGQETRIVSCTRAVLESAGIPLKEPLQADAYERLKTWVGKSVVEKAATDGGCRPQYAQTVPESEPEIEKGGATAVVSASLKTTPEPKPRPAQPEPVRQFASAHLVMPKKAAPGQKFPIEVQWKDGAVPQNAVYRFDLDGDGNFENIPGISENRVTHAFKKEGSFLIKAQITTEGAAASVLERQIMISKLPAAQLKATPASGAAGKTGFTFDASGSGAAGHNLSELQFKWIFERDGKREYPKGQGFTSEHTLKRTLEKTGLHRVGVQMKSRDGTIDSAWTTVNVISGVVIDYISGPRQAFAGQDIIFKCNISGGEAAGFTWRFKSGDSIAVERKTTQPQISLKLEKLGEYTVTCDVMGEKETIVSQQIALQIVNSPVTANAGGPYSAMVNKPVKLKGSAQNPLSEIILYEWYVSGSQKADFSSAAPETFEYVFSKFGKHTVIFSATAANGMIGRDTAAVEVKEMPPVANAGGDIVSRPGRKVRLRGTGSVPEGGEIIRYDWDFEGKGVYEWSSEHNGDVEHVFTTYSSPVLRVTNSAGVSATDTMRVIICPDDMVTVTGGKFCIDKYEWPNRRDSLPHANINWHNAQESCKSAGKRLCTETEWIRACRNDQTQKQAGKNAFPYGMEFDENKCNTLGNVKSKNKFSASGSFHECAGSLSVFDMSGNTAEWTLSSDRTNASAFGGFYQSGANDSNCESRVSLDKNRSYFFTGFRCCR
jgi:hypothetical protein